MSDVIVAPDGEGWTVRHERRLFERFAGREEACRKAARLARQLHSPDAPCAVREHRSFAPLRTPRRRVLEP